MIGLVLFKGHPPGPRSPESHHASYNLPASHQKSTPTFSPQTPTSSNPTRLSRASNAHHHFHHHPSPTLSHQQPLLLLLPQMSAGFGAAAMELGDVTGLQQGVTAAMPSLRESDLGLLKRAGLTQAAAAAASYPSPFLDEQKILRFSKAAHALPPSGVDFGRPNEQAILLSRTKRPFTPSQWMELEHQALIYKYLHAKAPIPSSLDYVADVVGKLLVQRWSKGRQSGWRSRLQGRRLQKNALPLLLGVVLVQTQQQHHQECYARHLCIDRPYHHPSRQQRAVARLCIYGSMSNTMRGTSLASLSSVAVTWRRIWKTDRTSRLVVTGESADGVLAHHLNVRFSVTPAALHPSHS